MQVTQKESIMSEDNQPISIGVGSILGIVSSLAAGIGAIIAAAAGNDTATVTAGAVGVLATITTMGGRFAQAVTTIKYAAKVASPWIDAAQDVLDDGPDPDDSDGSLI